MNLPSHIKIEYKGKIKEVKLVNFRRITGRKWLEWDYRKLFVNTIVEDASLKKYIESPIEIIDHFFLRYIDEHCGWGLFVCKPVSAGTVIAIQTGEIVSGRLDEDVKSGFVSEKGGEAISVDASTSGNLSHFISHLPSKKTMEQYAIDESLNNVAIENLSSHCIELTSGLVVSYFKASRCLLPGEIVGCAYTNEKGEIPMDEFCFFDTRGTPIPLFSKRSQVSSSF